MIKIVVEMDRVLINDQEVVRSPGISRSDWLRYWEAKLREGDGWCGFCGRKRY
jgi:hypothetical protein